MNLRICFVLASVLALCSCGPIEETNGGTVVIIDDVAESTQTCMDIMACIAACPDDDNPCLDACYDAGSPKGQDQLLGLLTCMDQNQCMEVTCIEMQCGTELNTCLDSSTTSGGSSNPGGTVPTGSIPSELVGHWVRAGFDDVVDFTFAADGSAAHSRYKESGIGSCDMAVNSVWNTGSAVANGDQLTITLAPGTTTVVWVGGCGSNYENPAEGKLFEVSYRVDLAASPPGVYLTDIHCSGDDCTEFYTRN